MERRRFSGVMLLFIVLAVVLITQVVGNLGRSGDVSYSDMRAYFTAEKVKSFTATDTRLVAKLQDGSSVSCALHSFDTFYNDMNDLVVSQAEKGVITSYDYAAGSENGWLRTLLPYVLAAMAFILLMNLIARMGGLGGGAVNDKMARFGEARIQDIPSDGKKVTFKDVAGADEEKEELEEIVQFLRDPQRYTELGAHIPKGVLLVGPPGTGKTLLAKAVAGEADTAFLSISGSDFVEMYVGVGASRVRDLFEQAKKQAPAIVFIDEIDAVGRQRGSGLGGGHDEREQTLNQLLVEMDGFEANDGIIVMAATNRPDVLDPALLRPGRFDRQITVNRPDAQGREDILKVHSRNKPLGPDVDLKEVAKDTIGFTGADLENLLNEAALLAVRRKKKALTMAEINDASSRVQMGTEKKSHKYSKKAKRLTAYHEAGHAVAAYYVEGHDPVKEISIIPRGLGAGGYTWYTPQEENYNSKKEMLDDLTTRDQRMMFGLVTLVHLADSKEQLDSDTETLYSTARKHLCQLSTLRWQQKDGLDTVLPYGLRKIQALRTLTTESTAVLIPFRAQEIMQPNGLYYGQNAVSKNMIVADRRLLLNGNSFRLGVSGSGKSMSAKEEIVQIALSTEDDILILDPESEFGYLTEALGGEVIHISATSDTHINALDMDRAYGDERNPIVSKSEFVLSLFEQLIGDGMVTAKEKSILGRCTEQVYLPYIRNGYKGTPPTLQDFYRLLQMQPEPEAQGLALSSELFITGTLNTFARHTNVDTVSYTHLRAHET